MKWIVGVSALVWLLACSKPARPEQDLNIQVMGRDFNWYIRYPGNDGFLQTEDDPVALRNLHVPAYTQVTIDITSSDYIYGFRIPALGKTQMAVPDIVFSLEFDSGPPAVHVLKGDQMCGFAHQSLIGEVVVEPYEQFQTWLRRQSTGF